MNMNRKPTFRSENIYKVNSLKDCKDTAENCAAFLLNSIWASWSHNSFVIYNGIFVRLGANKTFQEPVSESWVNKCDKVNTSIYIYTHIHIILFQRNTIAKDWYSYTVLSFLQKLQSVKSAVWLIYKTDE